MITADWYYIDIDLQARDGTGELVFSLNEQGFLYHAAAKSYHPARFALVDALGYVNLFQGALPGDDGNPQVLQPSYPVRAPYKDLVGVDGTPLIRRGKDAAGATATTRSTLRGTNLPLPDKFYLGILGKLDVATQSMFWASDDPTMTNGIGVTCVTGGTMRFYTQFFGTQAFTASAAGVNDGNRHLWEWIYDGSTVVCQKDRTVYSTVTAALAPLTGAAKNLRIGSGRAATNDDTAPQLQSSGEDDFYLVGDATKVDAAFLAAVKAHCLALHPSMTIA